MLDPHSPVRDEEKLYRSVPIGRGWLVPREEGGCRPSSQAFADREWRSSVDRAELLDNDPERAKFAPSDGVLWITAEEVRTVKVTKVEQEPGQPKVVKELFADVRPDPKPDDDPPRPAHALIELTPELGNRSNFNKLCERLARLASSGRWASQPATCE